jgi:flagellin
VELAEAQSAVEAALATLAGHDREMSSRDAHIAIAERGIEDRDRQLAVQNRLESTIRSLAVALENTAAAESQIRDVDFASETAELTRNQVLQQAGVSILGQANVSTQSALQLLG